MTKETARFIVIGALLVLAILLSSLDVTLFAVAPNAVLVVLVLAVLFLRDIWQELFLVACAAFFLKFSPIIDREIVSIVIIGLVMIIIARKLPWHAFVNGVFLIVSTTLAMYVIVDPPAVLSLIFVKELSYNIILMYVFYYGLMSLRSFRSVR